MSSLETQEVRQISIANLQLNKQLTYREHRSIMTPKNHQILFRVVMKSIVKEKVGTYWHCRGYTANVHNASFCSLQMRQRLHAHCKGTVQNIGLTSN